MSTQKPAAVKSNAVPVVSSPVTAVGSPVTVGSSYGVRADLPNFTASVRYFADANGDTLAVPGAGTVTISATGLASGQDTSITNGALDSTDVSDYVQWKHNCTEVTATPAGVTTATHYQLVILQAE